MDSCFCSETAPISASTPATNWVFHAASSASRSLARFLTLSPAASATPAIASFNGFAGLTYVTASLNPNVAGSPSGLPAASCAPQSFSAPGRGAAIFFAACAASGAVSFAVLTAVPNPNHAAAALAVCASQLPTEEITSLMRLPRPRNADMIGLDLTASNSFDGVTRTEAGAGPEGWIPSCAEMTDGLALRTGEATGSTDGGARLGGSFSICEACGNIIGATATPTGFAEARTFFAPNIVAAPTATAPARVGAFAADPRVQAVSTIRPASSRVGLFVCLPSLLPRPRISESILSPSTFFGFFAAFANLSSSSAFA